ncbi:MAG: cytochrome oxidase [Deltaproteobacteria bacterium]|nr:cytochrome oxidase [Deltaproteobacteria bacterium]
MNAIHLTLFVSGIIALLGVVLFIHSVGQRDHSHADRLSLLPLEDDSASPDSVVPESSRTTEEVSCVK